MNHRYVMLTQVADQEGVEHPIVVNTAHISTVEHHDDYRIVTLAYGRVLKVLDQWDDFQGFLDHDATH